MTPQPFDPGWRAALDALSEAVWLVHEDSLTILLANDAAGQLTGARARIRLQRLEQPRRNGHAPVQVALAELGDGSGKEHLQRRHSGANAMNFDCPAQRYGFSVSVTDSGSNEQPQSPHTKFA